MANYYIDETLGGDGGTGEIGDPWQSIDPKVNGESYSAGDSILFKKDEEWREQLTVPSSGSSGSVITFGAYGAGADPIINAAIDITTATYKWTASGSGTNEYYCELSGGGDPSIGTVGDIVIMDDTLLQEGTVGGLADHEWAYGDNDALGYSTVYVADATGDPDVSGVVIEASQHNNAIFINNKDYITLNGLTIKGGDDHGVLYWTGSTHLIVDDCLVHLNRDGIQDMTDSDYMTIQNSTIEYNFDSGIELADGSSYHTITGNIIRYNGVETAAGGNTHCGLTGYIDNSTISNNTIYDNCHSVTKGQGHGIYVQFPAGSSTNNNIFENIIYGETNGSGIKIASPADINCYKNFCHGCYAAGIVFTGFGVYDNATVQIYYNVLFNNFRGIWQTGTVGGTGCILNIYNNVMYKNDDPLSNPANPSEIHFSEDIGAIGTVNIKNNIIHGDDSNFEWFMVAQTGTFNVDNNCTRYGDFYYDGAWRNFAYWQGTAGFDTNGLNADPLMTNPAGDDFTLQVGSPCINAGVGVGLTRDYAGNPVGALPDIGAYEHQGVQAAPSQGSSLHMGMGMGLT